MSQTATHHHEKPAGRKRGRLRLRLDAVPVMVRIERTLDDAIDRIKSVAGCSKNALMVRWIIEGAARTLQATMAKVAPGTPAEAADLVARLGWHFDTEGHLRDPLGWAEPVVSTPDGEAAMKLSAGKQVILVPLLLIAGAIKYGALCGGRIEPVNGNRLDFRPDNLTLVMPDGKRRQS